MLADDKNFSVKANNGLSYRENIINLLSKEENKKKGLSSVQIQFLLHPLYKHRPYHFFGFSIANSLREMKEKQIIKISDLRGPKGGKIYYYETN